MMETTDAGHGSTRATHEAISLSGVSIGYGEKEVFRNLSLELEGGQVTALLGPNGAGKTSLLLVICGLLRPSAGRVLIGNKDVSAMGPRERARLVALLPQGLPSFIPFTVFETVLMGRFPLSSPLFFYSRRDREETERLLRETGLFDLRDRRCTTLSGGELQRVMIASVIAQETPVLLLDEPTASLDISQQVKIMKMVTEMARRDGKTVVLATHDLNLAAASCDLAVLLMGKDRVLCGPVKKVLTEDNIARLFDVKVRQLGDGKRSLFVPVDYY